MTDIHCHILPDYDDGAQSTAQALSMAQMAVNSGTDAIIATPHFTGSWSFEEDCEEIRTKFAAFKQKLEQADIPIELYCGSEILCTEQTPQMAKENKLITLNDTSYILLEFDFDAPYYFINDILTKISSLGRIPVIAHPERYEAVQRDLRIAGSWFKEGYILQMNKGSVLGSFGDTTEKTARDLLYAGLFHVVASDAHSDEFRTPHMGRLKFWLEDRCESEYVEVLTIKNPRRLLKGLPMVPVF